MRKGAYFKDERSLGGGGVDNIRKLVVTLSGGNSRGGKFIALLLDSKRLIASIVLSNNDIILRSEGGRGSKKA